MTAAPAGGLAAALARLCPPGVAAAALAMTGAAPPLHPGELAAMRGARVARQREFAFGRAAARLALADLGCADGPLPQRPDRAPDWPAGFTGSIAHAGTAAIAAAGRAGAWAGIGVDLEPEGAVAGDLGASILRDDEADLPQRIDGGLTAVFCAKEAAYKAISARAGTVLDFPDLALRSADADGFLAELCRTAGPLPPGLRLRGRWARAGGYRIALVAWPAIAALDGPASLAARAAS